MPAAKMHADEIEISPALVNRLLRAQFPHWADLPIRPVPSAGTDNALYRLGEDMLIRLPRIHWAAGQAEKEYRWLPRLSPHLPLALPDPLALGEPDEDYPWCWLICRWLDGENATLERIANPHQLALQLADFIHALQRIDPKGYPQASPGTSYRGEPLARRDADTCTAIAALDGLLDTQALTAVWETALQAPAWQAPPVWIHGDLQSGNLLARQGRLFAVIDFGCLGVGDPAYDVMTAWLYLPAETRAEFRSALRVDDATWQRARGLALSVGLIALPYYQVTNPVLAGIARRAIEAVLADFHANG
jgi:aminoglycoside phosphotransferase (APT) family kinase protein